MPISEATPFAPPPKHAEAAVLQRDKRAVLNRTCGRPQQSERLNQAIVREGVNVVNTSSHLGSGRRGRGCHATTWFARTEP